jgi:hypothetical protein
MALAFGEVMVLKYLVQLHQNKFRIQLIKNKITNNTKALQVWKKHIV